MKNLHCFCFTLVSMRFDIRSRPILWGRTPLCTCHLLFFLGCFHLFAFDLYIWPLKNASGYQILIRLCSIQCRQNKPGFDSEKFSICIVWVQPLHAPQDTRFETHSLLTWCNLFTQSGVPYKHRDFTTFLAPQVTILFPNNQSISYWYQIDGVVLRAAWILGRWICRLTIVLLLIMRANSEQRMKSELKFHPLLMLPESCYARPIKYKPFTFKLFVWYGLSSVWRFSLNDFPRPWYKYSGECAAWLSYFLSIVFFWKGTIHPCKTRFTLWVWMLRLILAGFEAIYAKLVHYSCISVFPSRPT